MFVAKIIFEVMAVLLLAYGFYHEEEIAAWERKMVKQIRKKRKAPSKKRRSSRGCEI